MTTAAAKTSKNKTKIDIPAIINNNGILGTQNSSSDTDANGAKSTSAITNCQIKPNNTKKSIKPSKNSSKLKKNEQSYPIYTKKLILKTSQAQFVMQTCYEVAVYYLFAVDAILRTIATEKQAETVEDEIAKNIAIAKDTLNKARTRFTAFIENHDEQLEPPTYSLPKEYTFEIKSPLIGEFAKLVVLLDQVVIMLDTLWLNALINNKEYKENRIQLCRKVSKISNQVMTIYNRGKNALKTKAAELSQTLEVDNQIANQILNSTDVETISQT